MYDCTLKTEPEKKCIASHVTTVTNQTNYTNLGLKVMDQEAEDDLRKIKEAIHIQRLSTDSYGLRGDVTCRTITSINLLTCLLSADH